MNIFADNAPKYWEAGIAVMPLHPNSKAAFLPNWQNITLGAVDHGWLTQFPTGNIYLPLGHRTGFVAVDVDTDDEKFQARLSDLIPTPVYKRVGKKGYAALYRTEGITKSARIRAEDGSMLVEVLGERTQCVMPPSIHPDTGKPYVSNVDLRDVLNDLPTLGEKRIA